jgi:phosphosulfolactate synthase (CoM biosynthesis protein A)
MIEIKDGMWINKSKIECIKKAVDEGYIIRMQSGATITLTDEEYLLVENDLMGKLSTETKEMLKQILLPFIEVL